MVMGTKLRSTGFPDCRNRRGPDHESLDPGPCCYQEWHMIVSLKHGQRFKPVRFFVMMGAAAFVVCAATAFYTHRATHGKTAPERAAYAIGEKAGEEAPADAKLPTAADLNM